RRGPVPRRRRWGREDRGRGRAARRAWPRAPLAGLSEAVPRYRRWHAGLLPGGDLRPLRGHRAAQRHPRQPLPDGAQSARKLPGGRSAGARQSDRDQCRRQGGDGHAARTRPRVVARMSAVPPAAQPPGGPPAAPEKIAIVGGGMSALTAAYFLTDPALGGRYE